MYAELYSEIRLREGGVPWEVNGNFFAGNGIGFLSEMPKIKIIFDIFFLSFFSFFSPSLWKIWDL